MCCALLLLAAPNVIVDFQKGEVTVQRKLSFSNMLSQLINLRFDRRLLDHPNTAAE